jgi:hypothetical protein
MTTELTATQTFENNIKERLVKDIGTLIPDEALTALVNKALEKAFFEPQKGIVGSGYNSRTENKPSVFEQQVKEMIQPLFEAKIKEWCNNNSERIEKELSSFLNSRAEDVFLSAIGSMFSSHFEAMKWNISNELQVRMQG